MTAGTPMSGRDTAAAFKGLLIGAIAIAAVVLTIVYLTNQKFAGHAEAAGETPAAETH
jgi:hypothetical protein